MELQFGAWNPPCDTVVIRIFLSSAMSNGPRNTKDIVDLTAPSDFCPSEEYVSHDFPVSFSLRLNSLLLDKIDKAAKASNTSRSDFVRVACEKRVSQLLGTSDKPTPMLLGGGRFTWVKVDNEWFPREKHDDRKRKGSLLDRN